MGQPVAVVEKPSSRPGLVRFEANRSLTGMGHERFRSEADAKGPRPSAVLARRLLATGRVDSVHVYQNVITVDLKKGFDSTGLGEVVADLYTYWRPGVEPPSIEELMAKVGGGEAAAAPAASGGGDAPSGPASRIPAHLLERSKNGMAKWREKHG